MNKIETIQIICKLFTGKFGQIFTEIVNNDPDEINGIVNIHLPFQEWFPENSTNKIECTIICDSIKIHSPCKDNAYITSIETDYFTINILLDE